MPSDPSASVAAVRSPAAGRRAQWISLFRNFFRRELFGRYLGSITGLAWALVHPLALLAIYHFVFTRIFRAAAFADQSFIVFVAVALWPWLAAQEAIQRATTSLAGYAGLIRKVAFPHELAVYAAIASTLVLQFAGYIVVLVALRALGEPLRLDGLLLAIPLWLILAIAIAGLGLLFAALQVFIRDVEHVLMPVLMMLMYLTPILYPLTLVPEGARAWVAANPFSWLVGRLRDAMIDGRVAVVPQDGIALAVALAIFFAGRWVFLRLSPHFEDFV